MKTKNKKVMHLIVAISVVIQISVVYGAARLLGADDHLAMFIAVMLHYVASFTETRVESIETARNLRKIYLSLEISNALSQTEKD